MNELPANIFDDVAFADIVPFNRGKDKILLLDFTENNTELNDDVLLDTKKFADHIKTKLKTENARYGIGGYGEHRTIYKRSDLFNDEIKDHPSPVDAEPRRLHLGIDIWGKPLTAVKAPLSGTVHSFAFNNNFGDYGATIILSHRLKNFSFYTLYGHLSLASIRNINGGDAIGKGDILGEFGIPQENGYWPPHLHFQIIKDLQGMQGDYPGVCKLSEKEFYLNNCPDPNLVLRML